MAKWLRRLLFLAALGAHATASAAGDPQAGETRSAACHACHGSDGISIADVWPNLAGQKTGYLIKQLTAFRDGTRQDPVMAIYAKGLTDQDIADIAAFYASLSGIAKPGPTAH